jgi:hypothetical protein
MGLSCWAPGCDAIAADSAIAYKSQWLNQISIIFLDWMLIYNMTLQNNNNLSLQSEIYITTFSLTPPTPFSNSPNSQTVILGTRTAPSEKVYAAQRRAAAPDCPHVV